MKISDVKNLKTTLAELPDKLTVDTQQTYAEFGEVCAKKYVPELLLAAGLAQETPEFKMNSCESCYWAHQKVKYGCSDCVDNSDYVSAYSSDGPKKKAEYEEKLRKEKP